MNRMKAACSACSRSAQKHRLLLGAVLSGLLAALLALYNVSSGPLSNMNDIGGWHNRALFIVLCAAVHGGRELSSMQTQKVYFPVHWGRPSISPSR